MPIFATVNNIVQPIRITLLNVRKLTSLRLVEEVFPYALNCTLQVDRVWMWGNHLDHTVEEQGLTSWKVFSGF